MENSESFEVCLLKDYLAKKGINFLAGIQENRASWPQFILHVSSDKIAEIATHGYISPRQMKNLQASIKKELGLDIEWCFSENGKVGTLESALLELLNQKFPSTISSVFLSSLHVNPVMVWLERIPQQETMYTPVLLEETIKSFFALYGIKDFKIVDDECDAPPSNPAILRRLKVVSPASVEQLAVALREAGGNIPQLHWLQSKLDTLRRQGLVVRSKTGMFCLTEFGLSTVPFNRTRLSSDVERVLALRQRKW